MYKSANRMTPISRDGERLRQKKQKQRIRFAFWMLGVLGVVLISTLLGVRHKTFAVRVVTINGNVQVQTTDIETRVDAIVHDERFHVFPPESILFVPHTRIVHMLTDSFPHIEHVTIERRWTDRTLFISVSERVGSFAWCGETREVPQEHCIVADEQGVLFDHATDNSTPLLRVFGVLAPSAEHESVHPLFARVEPPYLALMHAQKQALQEAGFNATEVVFRDKDVFFTLDKGFEVRLDATYPTTENIRALLSVLSLDELANVSLDALQYVDLRFGERVFYTFDPGAHE